MMSTIFAFILYECVPEVATVEQASYQTHFKNTSGGGHQLNSRLASFLVPMLHLRPCTFPALCFSTICEGKQKE